MRRARLAVYLIVIAPLHQLLLIAVALPVIHLQPESLAALLMAVVPLFAAALWCVLPIARRLLGPGRSYSFAARWSAVACGPVVLLLMFAGTGTGMLEVRNSFVLGALALIACHWLLFRHT